MNVRYWAFTTLFFALVCGTSPTAQAQSAAVPGPTYHNESVCILSGTHSDTFTAHTADPKLVGNGKTTSNIEINFVDADPSFPWPQDAKDAVRYAVDLWESNISSPVTLYVRATWADIGSPLAAGGPATSVSNFEGALPETRYPLALYRTMTGAALPPSEQLPDQADILITINRTKDWSYSTNGNPVAGSYDLVSVVMHEVSHGLGFIGSDWYYSGTGLLATPPLIYDRFVHDESGNSLVDTDVYPNPSSELGSALTSGSLNFDGSHTRSNSGTPAMLYAPPTWTRGTSYAHLDYGAYPPGSINSLMNPFTSTAEVQHSPGPLTCGILADMGWSLGPGCESSLPVELSEFEAVPNGRVIVLHWQTASEIDNAGFEVEHRSASHSFRALGFVNGAGTTADVSDYEFAIPGLEPGMHTFRLKQLDMDGTYDYSPEVEIAVEIPGAAFVDGPYPNPFNTSTTIEVQVKRSQEVRVDLFDMLGRHVRRVYSGTMQGDAPNRLMIDGEGLPAGAYVYMIRGEDFSESGMMQRI